MNHCKKHDTNYMVQCPSCSNEPEEPKRVYDGYHNMFVQKQPGDYYVSWVSRKKVPFNNGNKHPDCVSIIARHRATGKIPVIHQYRPVVGDYVYEFPAGKIDAGENPVEAAVREMKEETGLTLEDAIQVPFVFPSCGIIDECHTIVMGWCFGEESTDFTCDDEDINIIMADEKKLKEIVEEGKPISMGVAHYVLALHQNNFLMEALR